MLSSPDLTVLPNYKRFITTHNAEGKAVFFSQIEPAGKFEDSSPGRVAMSLAYITREQRVKLEAERDVKTYQGYLEAPPGLVSKSGSVLRVVDFAPEPNQSLEAGMMHSTVSLDYGVVMVGEVELLLDSGEMRTMKAGDICVQRATYHAWRDKSTTEWARVLFVLLPSEPLTINGEQLGEDIG